MSSISASNDSKKARRLLVSYRALAYEKKKEKRELLEDLLGSMGSNVSIGDYFLCDYGCNVHIGNHVSINMNCTFVDCNEIRIGNHVLISSNAQIYTPSHPAELSERLTPGWEPGDESYFCRTFALPVEMGDGCFIGGGVIILPGVTIGKGSVVGAGSVLTRDVPEHCTAAGNPCRVIRRIDK